MGDWQIHWLEAEGSLAAWREPIRGALETTRLTMARLVPVPRLDILVQPGTHVIPEVGSVGMAHHRSLFSLTVDPRNPAFARSLEDGEFSRGAVHEAHHCMRMGSVGYGTTLGETLVSEGLAGRFTQALFGNAPEPWECAVTFETLQAHFPGDTELAATTYDHPAWFFGTDPLKPRWLGYTLGYAIVGAWLDETNPIDGQTWIDVKAETVIAAAKPAFAQLAGRAPASV